MKIGMVHAFSNPISYMSLGEESRDLNKAIMFDTKQILEKQTSPSRTGVGVNQSYGFLENQYESIDRLKTIVDSLLSKTVMQSFHIETFQIPNSNNFWLNSNSNESAWHMPHTHNVIDTISGVYFPSSGIQDGVEISEAQDLNEDVFIRPGRPNNGDLIFMDPIMTKESMVMPNVRVNKYPFYGMPLCITPKAGTLVFFASWIPHLVAPTCKENFTRTSIAFGVRFNQPNV